jgi:hypothetical protein
MSVSSSERRRLQREERVLKITRPTGFIGGLAAGVWTFIESRSVSLAIYVFLIVLLVVGARLGEIITARYKLQRTLFALVLPVVSAVVLYFVYQASEIMWLSVVVGLIAGIVVSMLAGAFVFPTVISQDNRRKRGMMQTYLETTDDEDILRLKALAESQGVSLEEIVDEHLRGGKGPTGRR